MSTTHLNFKKEITEKWESEPSHRDHADFTSTNFATIQKSDPILPENTVDMLETTFKSQLIFLNEKKNDLNSNETEEFKMRVIIEEVNNSLNFKFELSSFVDIYFTFLTE